jgi:hypothetical protein
MITGLWHTWLMAKRPRDPNELAKLIVDISIGEAEDTVSESKRHPPQRGRAGGLKGGSARAKQLSPKRRSEIAKSAALSRWRKD